MFKELLSQVSKIKKEGSFVRHVTITSSWNVFGILAQFILSPVITRLYSPAEYGIFSLFNSIVLNVALIGTLKYSEAIILAPSVKQRNNAVMLSFSILSIVTALTLVIVAVFKNELAQFLGADWFLVWVYFIPVSIFFAGIIEILLITNVKRHKFFWNGLSGFLLNVVSRCFTIAYAGFYPAKATGLIVGDLTGKTAGIASLLLSFKEWPSKLKSFFQSIDFTAMKAIARSYRHFPFFNLPTAILASVSGHIPIYFLQFQYNSTAVGAFALSSSLLEIINRLIPYSIASVFFPKAMEMKRESHETLIGGVNKLFWYALFGSAIIFCGLALTSQKLFPWVFGSNWATAGGFMAILAIQYSVGFVSITITEVFKVIGKQRLLLTTTILSVTLRVAAILIAISLKLDVSIALLIYSLAGAIGSFIQVITVFVTLKVKVIKIGISLFMLVVTILGIIYFLTF